MGQPILIYIPAPIRTVWSEAQSEGFRRGEGVDGKHQAGPPRFFGKGEELDSRGAKVPRGKASLLALHSRATQFSGKKDWPHLISKSDYLY